jgi:hypothetical protein
MRTPARQFCIDGARESANQEGLTLAEAVKREREARVTSTRVEHSLGSSSLRGPSQ